MIIRNFDESISRKADKVTLKGIYDLFEDLKQIRDSLKGQNSELHETIKSNNSEILFIKDNLKQNYDKLEKKITKDLNKATADLQQSYFEDFPNQTKAKKNEENEQLNRKVDIQEFQNQLSMKTDKNESVIINEQINVIRNQIA